LLDSAYELPKDIARKVWKALSLLSKNPGHPGLNLEALHGKAEGLQSVRVDDQYRIILQPDPNVTRLLFVGAHDKAYQFAERLPAAVPLEAEVPFVAEQTVLYSPDLAATSRPPVIPENTVKELLLRTVKYLPLASFLVSRPMFDKSVQLTFSKIEEVIRSSLPVAARRYRAWWANEAGRTQHVQARGAGALGSGSSWEGKDNMEMDQVLGEFEKRLRNARRGEGGIKTHIRRVSTYLRWCGSNGYNHLQEASCEAFLKSRKSRGNKPSAIEAYS
jgi:mRNA-degrading endonuclease RelE of RelBE toxin-antitoxin system